ncbi:restriction endonuclease subunit S [Thiolapillus sp.]|uniref:restriction endonuclease subunit S n=1 Tax=Thiolapillus sp. TaxID=2017437 RepID=UPI0025D81944|nr:restriction endonuclease subunit S [Thiolapillus sp.]
MASLPQNWNFVPLKELCQIIQYGYTASASKEPIGPKFLRITDIVPNHIDWGGVPFCKIESNKEQKYLLSEGDIVVARTGATTGFAKRIGNHPPAVFASYLVRLRVKEGVDSRYVGHVIESDEYKRFIKTHIGGAAQPNANAQVLTSFPMPVPPVGVQQKIAAILSAYDDLIENNLRRIKILEEIAQNLYREWFVKFRFPGHAKVRMVDSPLGKIPEGWDVRRLSDVCNLVMGQSPKSEFYNEEGKGLPFHQGVTDFGNRFPKTRLYCSVKSRLAAAGDILFSVRAPVGRINIAPTEMVIGRGLSAIRHSAGFQWFAFHLLKEKFKEEDSMGGGTIFKAVTKVDMQGIEFLSADNETHQRFEEIVLPVESQVENLTIKNSNLRQTRDLLLPKLISGELDVSELEINTGKKAA